MLGPVLGCYLCSCCMFFLGNLTQTLSFESQLYSDDSQQYMSGPEFYSQPQTLILIKLSLSSKLLWPKLKSYTLFLFLKPAISHVCLSHLPICPIQKSESFRLCQLPHEVLTPIWPLNSCQVCLPFPNLITSDLAQATSISLIWTTVSFWHWFHPFYLFFILLPKRYFENTYLR